MVQFFWPTLYITDTDMAAVIGMLSLVGVSAIILLISDLLFVMCDITLYR